MITKSTARCGSLPTCTSPKGNSRFICKWFIIIRWFWHISNGSSTGLVIKVITKNSRVRAGGKGDHLANLASEFSSSLDVLTQMILSGSVLHFPSRCSHFQLNVALERGASLSWQGSINYHWLLTPVTQPTLNLVVHLPFGSLIQTWFSTLYIPCSCCSSCVCVCVGGNIINPLTLTWYLCIMLAGAEEGETLSLGVTLCQYTASWTMLCFLAAMVFIVLWHLLTDRA